MPNTGNTNEVLHAGDAILSLFILVTYVESPFIIMGTVSGDQLDPSVEASSQQAIDKHWPNTPPIQRIDRFDFYERAEQALAVLMAGEAARYGNIILIKGVTPITRK